MAADIHPAHIDKDCMKDPVNPNFFDEIWNRAAQNNTKLYRRVFRCMPDSEVSTWAEYREYMAYGERFRSSMEGRSRSRGEDSEFPPSSRHRGSTSAGAGVGAPGPEVLAKAAQTEAEKAAGKLTEKLPFSGHHDDDRIKIVIPDEGPRAMDEKQALHDGEGGSSRPNTGLDSESAVDTQRPIEAPSPVYSVGDVPFPAFESNNGRFLEPQTSTKNRERRTTFSTLEKPSSRETNAPPPGQFGSVKRRRRATTKNSRRGVFTVDDMPSRTEAEELLNMVQGNIVQFPYDWLLTEEQNGNWGYQVDGVAPLAI
jgi:phospholipase D1/2